MVPGPAALSLPENLLEIQKAIATAKTPEGDLKYGPESVEIFYGQTKSEDRQSIVEKFQDPQSPLRFFVGQPRTGGYGLTLTEAKTVIYFSNGYDLEVRLQSEDRAHRIGQTNKVTYIDIVCERTVDEKIVKALRMKQNIAQTVLGEEKSKNWLV